MAGHQLRTLPSPGRGLTHRLADQDRHPAHRLPILGRTLPHGLTIGPWAGRPTERIYSQAKARRENSDDKLRRGLPLRHDAQCPKTLPATFATPRSSPSAAIELTALVESTQPQSVPAAFAATLGNNFVGVTLSRLQTLEETRSDSVAAERSTALLLATFATLGLLLGVAGVYGFIAHRAAQRTREIGIRLAFGASAAHVITLVVHETLFASLAGCTAGVTAAFAFSHLLASLLFGITNHDPVAFVTAPVALLLAATTYYSSETARNPAGPRSTAGTLFRQTFRST